MQRASADRLSGVLDRLSRQGRAATRATLMHALGAYLVERAIAEGDLVRLLPGVYAPAAIATDHRVRCHAVSLATGERALIAGRSALHLYKERFPAPPRVEAVVAPGLHMPTAPWLAVRRRARPAITSAPAAIRSLTSEDAVVDAWIRAAPSGRKGVLYEALWLRIATARQVWNAQRKLARVSGRPALTRILDEFLEGAHSPGEVMARREVFNRPGDRVWERQVPLVVAGGRRVVDMLHRRARLVAEVDGAAYHDTDDARARDRVRDTELSSAGFQTVHFGFRDLRDRPEWCREMLDRTLAHRLRDLGLARA